MSNVRGRIAVDVQFSDSTTADGVQSLKTLTLQDATEYASGKVAIVTGTVGTAAQTISLTQSYKDAAGNFVSFSSVNRFAFRGTPGVSLYSGFTIFGASKNNAVSVVSNPISGDALSLLQITASNAGTAGTASYTLVIYGA